MAFESFKVGQPISLKKGSRHSPVVPPLSSICSEDPITPELFPNNISTAARGGEHNTDRFEHVMKLLALLKGRKSGRQHILDIFWVDLRTISSRAGVRPHKNCRLTRDNLGKNSGQEAAKSWNLFNHLRGE